MRGAANGHGPGHRQAAAVRPHADFLADFSGDRFRKTDAPGEYQNIVQRLVNKGLIAKVDDEPVKHPASSTPRYRWVYRVREWAAGRARTVVAERDAWCPCGHSGIRNLGDGRYACGYQGCARRFGRSEIDAGGDS